MKHFNQYDLKDWCNLQNKGIVFEIGQNIFNKKNFMKEEAFYWSYLIGCDLSQLTNM